MNEQYKLHLEPHKNHSMCSSRVYLHTMGAGLSFYPIE